MTDEQKVKLADAILSAIKDFSDKPDDSMPVMVGTLSKAQGINGFVTAGIGHPVFELKDRYIIYLERNDGKMTVAVPYYKDSLFGRKFIQFKK